MFNNALYFRADDGVHGQELWKYDGTTASFVADINPGFRDSYPLNLTVFNNALYFAADKDAGNGSLWKYDGTTASLVADINLSELTVFDNALYFNGDDGVNGYELWRLEPDKPTSVPEPASVLGLLAFGAFGAGSMLKRKLQKAAQLGIVDSEITD